MKKLLAIALTTLLIVAFSFALIACNQVDKEESIEASIDDVTAILAKMDEDSSHWHSKTTTVTNEQTTTIEYYYIDIREIEDATVIYFLDDASSTSIVYTIYTDEEGNTTYELASGFYGSSNTTYKKRYGHIYGTAKVAADGTIEYSVAMSFDLSTSKENSYAEYEIKFKYGTDLINTYGNMVTAAKNNLSNILASAESTRLTSAVQRIVGKDVISKTYTIAFDLGTGADDAAGTATLVTDADGVVTLITIEWDNGNSVSTEYIQDASGVYYYSNIFEISGSDNLDKFYTLCGIDKKDPTE